MKKERLFYLDFIRFFAFFIILIFHFSRITSRCNITGFPKLDLFANGDWGFIAVAIFFILSGYSLTKNYSINDVTIKKFYCKRFLNIFPYYWIVYIIAFVFLIFTTGTVANYAEISENYVKIGLGAILTLLGLDGYLTYTFYLIGEWFLPCIIVIYAVYPLLNYFYKKHSKILFGVSFIIYMLVLFFEKYSPILIHRNILVCMFQFIIGMYILKISKENKINLKTFLVLLIISIIGVTIKLPIHSSIVVTIVAISIFYLLWFIAIYIKSIKLKGFITKFSKLSFIIFLVHHVTMNEILRLFSDNNFNTIEAVLLFLLCFIIIIIISLIVDYIIKLIFKIINSKRGNNYVEKNN